MKEIIGNLWDFHTGDNWIVITTNGFVKANGEAVMGAGVAKQAATRMPNLPKALGDAIRCVGNRVVVLSHHIVALPVKHFWWEKADISLITRCIGELLIEAESNGMERVYMPRPGCGNGGLRWEDVRPLLVDRLDDRFTIVEVNQ